MALVSSGKKKENQGDMFREIDNTKFAAAKQVLPAALQLRALGSEQSSPCHPWKHSHWPMFGDVRCLMALSVGTACMCAAWLARTGGVRALCVRVAGAGAPWLPRSPALARQPTHNPGVQSFAV
jgi:hypothetical protein